MTNIARYSVSAALVLGFLTLSPLALTADAPVVVQQPIVEEDSVFANCGDFLILANGSGTARTTVFLDQDGNPSKILFQGRYNGTLSNSVTGATLTDAPSVANITLDLEQGTQTNVGTFFNITAPGEGGVFFQTGRIVFPLGGGAPVFIAGQQPPPWVLVAVLCEALS